MSGPTDERRDDLIVAWVLGELPEGERAAFAARLAAEPDLAREVAATEDALALFATSAPVAPPPGLRDRVLQAAASPSPAPASRPAAPSPARPAGARVTPWLTLALAASLILAVKFWRDADTLRRERDAVRTQVVAITDELAQRDSLLAQLVDPGTELVTLAATGAQTPQVRVLLDRKRQLAVVSGAALEAVPTGETYQLWYIVDGTPVPSRTFVPAADGTVLLASVELPATGTVQAVAVTREPAGGSTTPTMPILFVGSVGTE